MVRAHGSAHGETAHCSPGVNIICTYICGPRRPPTPAHVERPHCSLVPICISTFVTQGYLPVGTSKTDVKGSVMNSFPLLETQLQ